jgi:hypothetical protein
MQLLKYKLRSLNIPLAEVEEYIFQHKHHSDGHIAYEDLMQALATYPFSISNQITLESICSYIFDGNENQRERVERVRSILRTLLENYKIIGTEQRQSIETELYRHLRTQRLNICDIMNRKKSQLNMAAFRYRVEVPNPQ